MIMNMEIEFIYKWQTLIGSAAGPFLALILSAFSFWVKTSIDRQKNYQESLRKIEISITRSLNDIANVKVYLDTFHTEIINFSNEIRKNNPDDFFAGMLRFQTINTIFNDPDLPRLPTKSYYLHNKILYLYVLIQRWNQDLSDFKDDYKDIRQLNEMTISLSKSALTPQIQRNVYATNLEEYAKNLEDYVSKNFEPTVQMMVEIKIYVSKIRSRFGFINRWRYENTKKKEPGLKLLADIDELIKEDVLAYIEKHRGKS